MAFIILFILLFAFSTFVGFQVGTSLGERAQTTADYWKMNAGAIVAAVLLTLVCSSMPLLWAAIIGMLAGAIAGMKMSFGESVGPWKAHDEFSMSTRSIVVPQRRGRGSVAVPPSARARTPPSSSQRWATRTMRMRT